MIGLMVVLLTFLSHGQVTAILGNGYGIQGQNHVALLQGSEMPAGLHYRNLILGI